MRNTDISTKNLFMETEEAEKLFASIGEAEKKYEILLLLVLHGCRPCEAVKLHLSDFVKDDCTEFYVDNTKVVRKGKNPRRDLKIMPSWVGEEIRKYIETGLAFGDIRGGYLFPSNRLYKHRSMSPHSLLTWFARKRQQIGLTDIVGWKPAPPRMREKGIKLVPQYRCSPYSLRRLFATELGVRGADQRVIALMMGHSDTRITMGYQDKAKLFRLAPAVASKMPRFFSEGQISLKNFCG